MKKVIVVSKTHLDLGFTDYAENIRQKYINTFIPSAVALAENIHTESDKKFIWTTGSWILKEALENGTDLRATLFKAGHHGSATSNTEEFVQAVHPRIAVVSCGENNSYGHPHEDVLETFRREGVQVFRTDLNGTVVAYVDEENVLRIAVTKSEEAEAASLTAVA